MSGMKIANTCVYASKISLLREMCRLSLLRLTLMQLCYRIAVQSKYFTFFTSIEQLISLMNIGVFQMIDIDYLQTVGENLYYVKSVAEFRVLLV